jgi:hypothetical protein
VSSRLLVHTRCTPGGGQLGQSCSEIVPNKGTVNDVALRRRKNSYQIYRVQQDAEIYHYAHIEFNSSDSVFTKLDQNILEGGTLETFAPHCAVCSHFM